MKAIHRALAAALLLLAIPASGWSGHDRLRNEVRQLHTYLHDHPKISSELRDKPSLVNNKKYLAKHPELAKFLKRHPRVKQEIVNHPARVFGSYYRDNARWRH